MFGSGSVFRVLLRAGYPKLRKQSGLPRLMPPGSVVCFVLHQRTVHACSVCPEAVLVAQRNRANFAQELCFSVNAGLQAVVKGSVLGPGCSSSLNVLVLSIFMNQFFHQKRPISIMKICIPMQSHAKLCSHNIPNPQTPFRQGSVAPRLFHLLVSVPQP